MKCDLCLFETDNRERFAGHRSGHVRRGEVQKRVNQVPHEHQCKICLRVFKTGVALGGHVRFHGRTLENVVSPLAKKSRLIETRGCMCEICKLNAWMGSVIPLTIDHIDGNSANNLESNLRLLCPNCHAQTPTFGGKNIGRYPGGERYRAMKEYRAKLAQQVQINHQNEGDVEPLSARTRESVSSSLTVLTTSCTTKRCS